ncbi:c-type cytochrome biogenesis protein CcmI [Nitratireductor sp. GCM10026969]|uniref:c-type cytochrome biogenesis protein CcmI n=1 Tax=Nitratireductor sp. GCM10026969 TaxID=3252645 RepID=UPI003623820E
MLFWVLAALLTLAASLAVMYPFLRGRLKVASGAQHDLSVYRDQLAELEQEMRRGLISKEDATEARAEIGRRILRLEQEDSPGSWTASGRTARVVATAAVLVVPVLSWSLYALTGSPGMPASPLEQRLAGDPAQATVEELIARAEAFLASNPDDVRGWETLAPIYARLGRYSDAVDAYRKTIELSGASAAREAALGEALVGQAGGIVTADAEAAFARALSLDGANPRARFFMAMARAQEGNAADARSMWNALAADLPEESPWRQAARRAVAGLSAGLREESPPGKEGPTQEDLAAADQMSPQARQEMIEGMVSSLDARLREDPSDTDAWRRLLRSYVVLGRQEEAADALQRAVAALDGQSAEATALIDYAETLGISRSE